MTSLPRQKWMMVGRTGAGKSTLCQWLCREEPVYRKTQSIEIVGQSIDTPGEYVENRGLFKALVVTAADADRVVLLQSCVWEEPAFPPGFANMFGKPVVGLVTKTDMASGPRDWKAAEEKLRLAGCDVVLFVSIKDGQSLETLRDYLDREQAVGI